MQHVTRSQFIEKALGNFLSSSEKSTNIDLYGEEIRKFSKNYEDVVSIIKGPKTNASAVDKRYNCTVTKR